MLLYINFLFALAFVTGWEYKQLRGALSLMTILNLGLVFELGGVQRVILSLNPPHYRLE